MRGRIAVAAPLARGRRAAQSAGRLARARPRMARAFRRARPPWSPPSAARCRSRSPRAACSPPGGSAHTAAEAARRGGSAARCGAERRVSARPFPRQRRGRRWRRLRLRAPGRRAASRPCRTRRCPRRRSRRAAPRLKRWRASPPERAHRRHAGGAERHAMREGRTDEGPRCQAVGGTCAALDAQRHAAPRSLPHRQPPQTPRLPSAAGSTPRSPSFVPPGCAP